MEIDCPICSGKVLPFKVSQSNLIFLCTSKKCSFPLGHDSFSKYSFSVQTYPQCIFQAQTAVIRYKTQGITHLSFKSNPDLSDSTDLDPVTPTQDF